MLSTQDYFLSTCIIHRQTLYDKTKCLKCPKGICKDRLNLMVKLCELCNNQLNSTTICEYCLQCDKCSRFNRLPHYCRFCEVFFGSMSIFKKLNSVWLLSYFIDSSFAFISESMKKYTNQNHWDFIRLILSYL